MLPLLPFCFLDFDVKGIAKWPECNEKSTGSWWFAFHPVGEKMSSTVLKTIRSQAAELPLNISQYMFDFVEEAFCSFFPAHRDVAAMSKNSIGSLSNTFKNKLLPC